MDCQAAQHLLFSERDGALEFSQRASLAEHLGHCAECRRTQASLRTAVDRWRSRVSATPLPDAERAWQDIRREIRTTAPHRSAVGRVVKWSLPFGVAAGLGAALMLWPHATPRHNSPATIARAEQAHADFVEVAGDAGSLVYVDDQSGWLVVWAVNDDSHHAGS